MFDGRCYRYVYPKCSNAGTRHCQLTVRDHRIFAHRGSADVVKQLVGRIVGALDNKYRATAIVKIGKVKEVVKERDISLASNPSSGIPPPAHTGGGLVRFPVILIYPDNCR